MLERDNPEQYQEMWIAAMAGAFKGYSTRVSYPRLLLSEIELRGGHRTNFMIFGAFGKEEVPFKPGVLVLMSEDSYTRIVGKAKWNGDWPEVEEVDAILGRTTVADNVGGVKDDVVEITEPSVVEHGVQHDEVFDVINRIALSLRFPTQPTSDNL